MKNHKVLAKVDDREITQADINMFMQSLNPQAAAQFQSPEGQKQLLEELINQELLYLDGLDKKLDEEDSFLQELERAKSSLLKQYAISKILGGLGVSDEEVEGFFQDNSDRFIKPASIQASHILVETKEKAEDIINEINNGLAFEEAANKYSSCPSKEKGGDLGSFSKGQMVPEFDEVAFHIEVDTLSQPVKTQFGYHIIKVTGKADEISMTIDEARPQIEKQILNQKQQRTYFETIDRIKHNHKITIL